MEKKYLTNSKDRTYSKWTCTMLDHINLRGASESDLVNLLIEVNKELVSRKNKDTNKK